MPIDSSKIAVISSVKVDKDKLLNVGDSDSDQIQKTDTATLNKRRAAVGVKDQKCSMCCALWGAGMTTVLGLVLSTAKTMYFLYTDARLQNYAVGSVLKHIGWITIPGVIVGGTLHFMLSEAMWSSRRNSYGMAWTKALAMNTAAWCFAIGSGTLVWRKGIRYSRWSKYYYKYPIPPEKLELRKIENPDVFWSGMGWSYWLLGVLMGQFGYACCTALCVYQNRVHFMMSPVGPYATRCLPRWRREQIARAAHYELSPTQ